MNISKYNDIGLNKTEYSSVTEHNTADTDIKYDWFDYYMSNGKSVEVYAIEKQNIAVGYVALYDHDGILGSVCLYGKVFEKQYFGDLLKSILSVMEYAYTSLKVSKIYFVYREDNYFFDDLCRFLRFIKEGILRNHLLTSNEYFNLNVYGLLLSEYQGYKVSEYKRMFTWNNNYTPKEYINVDIHDKFNCRSFTNVLNNPNHALMNDGLNEFALNKAVSKDDCLTYKDIRFPIKIFDMKSRYDSLICQGQVIDIPEDRYEDILFVATAQFGYKETYIAIEYSDGEVENVEFTLSDWCERVLRDEYVIHYAYGCRRLSWGTNVIKCDSFLFLKRIAVRSDKAITQIKLPVNQDILVYSMALVK